MDRAGTGVGGGAMGTLTGTGAGADVRIEGEAGIEDMVAGTETGARLKGTVRPECTIEGPAIGP